MSDNVDPQSTITFLSDELSAVDQRLHESETEVLTLKQEVAALSSALERTISLGDDLAAEAIQVAAVAEDAREVNRLFLLTLEGVLESETLDHAKALAAISVIGYAATTAI